MFHVMPALNTVKFEQGKTQCPEYMLVPVKLPPKDLHFSRDWRNVAASLASDASELFVVPTVAMRASVGSSSSAPASAARTSNETPRPAILTHRRSPSAPLHCHRAVPRWEK